MANLRANRKCQRLDMKRSGCVEASGCVLLVERNTEIITQGWDWIFGSVDMKTLGPNVGIVFSDL